MNDINDIIDKTDEPMIKIKNDLLDFIILRVDGKWKVFQGIYYDPEPTYMDLDDFPPGKKKAIIGHLLGKRDKTIQMTLNLAEGGQ